MWFEILPSFGVVFAALTIPHVANYWINRACTGRPYRRKVEENHDMFFYNRDRRLTGNVYKLNGLESIPDN